MFGMLEPVVMDRRLSVQLTGLLQSDYHSPPLFLLLPLHVKIQSQNLLNQYITSNYPEKRRIETKPA